MISLLTVIVNVLIIFDMTKRQKEYREYLKTDHWKKLRGIAIDRDKCCKRCNSVINLQVHHKKYRGTPLESEIMDLETLCRKCHQSEHGFGPDAFEVIARKVRDHIHSVNTRPPVEMWKEFKRCMAGHDDQLMEFSSLMKVYTDFILPLEKYPMGNFWMDERGEPWRKKGMRIRQMILSRSETWEHFRK